MKRLFAYPLIGLFLSRIITFATSTETGAVEETIIAHPSNPTWAEDLAAREVRRYIYLRTGRVFPLRSGLSTSAKAKTILVATKGAASLAGIRDKVVGVALDSLKPQSYLIKTISDTAQGARQGLASDKPETILLIGGDDSGILYAAYRFAEQLGVRCYLDGDVIPDQQQQWTFPNLDIRESPLFALRGIQPFHDFPEGPDWWSREDYLAIVGQLPKLGMNFFGLHTYPEGRPNAEPTVWIGFPSDLGRTGEVRFSYPSSYQNTLRGNWGYTAQKTAAFVYGTDQLFETDAFGPETAAECVPEPSTPEACNEVFNRTAAMLGDAFRFAHRLGVKTCVGTETPLVLPKAVQARAQALGKAPADETTVRQLYEGIFQRATAAYPLDYYWFWTPEGWTWSGVKPEEIAATTNDLFSAIEAWKAVHPPFALATCGWVLGPPQDRAMFDKVLPKDIAVSCINRQVGYTPVDAGFKEVAGRSKWAIPWMEDDPALTSPQLWVGRMRRDAADALRYGCDGLMGIHWRTRVLGPNVSALAHAGWNQQPWVDTYKPAPPLPSPQSAAGPIGGQVASFPNNPIAGTEYPALYQTVRYNLSGYHLPASNGPCRVTLRFSEPHYDGIGKRVFDVTLQGQTVLTNLDIFERVGKNRALDFTFEGVPVNNGWLDIHFVPRIEFPSIAALEAKGEEFSTRINCGGPAYGDFAADAPGTAPDAGTFAETEDFYLDWARHQFGEEAGTRAAPIFEKMDCHLPTPSVWTDGPGGIKPDDRRWDVVRKDYEFAEDFARLRLWVKGAGNLERFDYWLNTFQYFRTIAEVSCAWGEYERVLAVVKGTQDETERRRLARELALPARRALVQLTSTLFKHLMATVSTTGELGTVANWNQHNLPALLIKPGEELTRLMGESLPPDCQPETRYHGPTRLLVPAQRTSLPKGEALNLKIIVVSEKPPATGGLYWRRMGSGRFRTAPLWHVSRGVYSAQIPPSGDEDLEYYITIETQDGCTARFPATAPNINQTLVRTRPGS